ncbi:MAG: SHOCT domain-containing protein [Clostridia bacterium]|nr:SHOCT domain-containing protein [Clostridia bacterium]
MVIILAYVIQGLIFGFIAKYIAESKGYDTGFAWGFWLGIIGLLVVGFRPTILQTTTSHATTLKQSEYWSNLSAAKSTPSGWTCVCGQDNAYGLSYCTKCRRSKDESANLRKPKVECHYCGAKNNASNEECFACGRSLKDSINTLAAQTVKQETPPTLEMPKQVVGDVDSLEALKKLAELRDLGVLTENEFQEKKATIMAKI